MIDPSTGTDNVGSSDDSPDDVTVAPPSETPPKGATIAGGVNPNLSPKQFT